MRSQCHHAQILIRVLFLACKPFVVACIHLCVHVEFLHSCLSLCDHMNCRLPWFSWASQVVTVVKNPPANAGDIRNTGSILGWGRSLEEGMATHSNILAHMSSPDTEKESSLMSLFKRVLIPSWRPHSHDLIQT